MNLNNIIKTCLPGTLPCSEHHQYCRPPLCIMPLRVLFTVGRGKHHGPHYLTSLNPTLTTTRLCLLSSLHAQPQTPLLSGVPDYFDRNKILSGYDLSHYQVPHCIKSFLLFCLICVYSSQFSILFQIMYLL